jgi:hypothetical protein
VLPILRAASFQDAEIEPCDVALLHPGGAAALGELATEVGPAARILRLSGAGDADRAALREEVEAALRGSLRMLRRSSAEDRGYVGEELLG